MSRKVTPAHLRKSGPGTAGHYAERNANFVALADKGTTYAEIARQFPPITRERVRQIVGRLRYLATAKPNDAG